MSLSTADFKKLQSVVTFHNISDELFEHPYAWDNAPPMMHSIEAREKRVLPYPIAIHLARHLARKIIRGAASVEELAKKRPIATIQRVEELAMTMLSDASTAASPAPKDANELIRDHIEQLNPADREVVAPTDGGVQTKRDIIEQLEAQGKKYNARATKAELQSLLNE